MSREPAGVDELLAQAALDAEAARRSIARWVAEQDAALDEERRRQVRVYDAMHAAADRLNRRARVPRRRKRSRGRHADARAVLLDAIGVADDGAEGLAGRPANPVPCALATDTYYREWAVVLREGVYRTLLEWASYHVRVERDPRIAPRPALLTTARWDDEVRAMRDWWDAGAKVRSGAQARLEQRLSLGGSVSSATRPREPVEDPWIAAFERCWYRLDPDVRLALTLAHLEVDPPRNTYRGGKDPTVSGVSAGVSAAALSARVRRGEGSLPMWSELEAGPHVTTALLVAEAMSRRLHGGAMPKGYCDRVADMLRDGRRLLRELLGAVRIDVHPHRALPELPGRRVDAAGLDERAARRARRDASLSATVECCAGAPAFTRTARQPCDTVAVEGPAERHPSAAWPRCSHCDRPAAPPRRHPRGRGGDDVQDFPEGAGGGGRE